MGTGYRRGVALACRHGRRRHRRDAPHRPLDVRGARLLAGCMGLGGGWDHGHRRRALRARSLRLLARAPAPQRGGQPDPLGHRPPGRAAGAPPGPADRLGRPGGPCSTRWWTRGWCGRRSQQPRPGAAGGFAGTHPAAVGGRPGAAEPGPPAVGGGRRARQHRRSSRGRGGGAGGARGIGGAGAGPGVRWSAGGTPGGSVATPRWPRQQPRRRPPRSWPTWPPRTARRASPWCSSGCRRTRRASRRWWGPPRRGGWCLRGRRGRAGPPGP